MTRAFVDKYLHKFMSRKLIVWATSTALLIASNITGDQWVAISLAWIGSQGIADIAVAWKSGNFLKR